MNPVERFTHQADGGMHTGMWLWAVVGILIVILLGAIINRLPKK